MRDDLPKSAITRARTLRREMTDAETKLWWLLRHRKMQGVKFRRQVPVGPYIADFLCVSHGLIVEADGSQHAESPRDMRRDAYLAEQGFRVLRFWNHEILQTPDAVLDTIAAACGLEW